MYLSDGEQISSTDGGTTRRELLKRSIALGLSVPTISLLLAACGGDDDEDEPDAPTPSGPVGGDASPTSESTAPEEATAEDEAEETPTDATSQAEPSPTAAAPASDAGSQGGGSFLAAHSTSISSMDPAMQGEPQARSIRGCVTESLFDLDAEGNLIPRLAESWEQTDDTTYVLQLRQGVTFHDGTPFDAEAVKFNLERMRDPETANVWANEISQLDTVEVLDTHTIQLTTTEPFAPFLIPLYDLNGMQLSPTAVEEWGEDIGFHPVGTGPFRFVELSQDEHVILERNPDYWQPDRPRIDELTFRYIANDATRLTEVRSGGAHLAEYLPFQDIERLREADDIVVSEKPGFRVDWIQINTREGWPGHSREFRQAFNWLFDRDAIHEAVYQGIGQPAWDLFLPGTRFFDPDYQPTHQDLDRARELLAASGVEFPLDIPMYLTQDPVRQREAQIIQAVAAEVDINIDIQIVDPARFNELEGGGEFVLSLSWWGYRPDPDQYLGVVLETGGGWNRTGYSSPEMDALLQAERVELNDTRRIGIFRQIAELITEDAALIPYHYGSNTKGLSPNVENFVHRVDGLVRYDEIRLV